MGDFPAVGGWLTRTDDGNGGTLSAGNSPVKYIAFGGVGITPNRCRYLCLSGVTLLIFMSNVSKSIDVMSNSCYYRTRLVEFCEFNQTYLIPPILTYVRLCAMRYKVFYPPLFNSKTLRAY
jgi:hypothetical protein